MFYSIIMLIAWSWFSFTLSSWCLDSLAPYCGECYEKRAWQGWPQLSFKMIASTCVRYSTGFDEGEQCSVVFSLQTFHQSLWPYHHLGFSEPRSLSFRNAGSKSSTRYILFWHVSGEEYITLCPFPTVFYISLAYHLVKSLLWLLFIIRTTCSDYYQYLAMDGFADGNVLADWGHSSIHHETIWYGSRNVFLQRSDYAHFRGYALSTQFSQKLGYTSKSFEYNTRIYMISLG